MKILVFSWRDIKNPKSGGAEVLTHEIVKRWVKLGNSVTVVSSRFSQSKYREKANGVEILRPAEFNYYSPIVYINYIYKTVKFYKKELKNDYDIIVDQVHGLPLFTPFFVKERVVFYPLEVAKDIWRFEIPFPFWPFGWILEYSYIKLFKNFPFLTISQSTANDLIKLGVKNVRVSVPGINLKTKNKVTKKEINPLIVSLSRLTPMKRIEATLRAFSLVILKTPQCKLLIVGHGKKSYVDSLKKLCKELKIAQAVRFTGFVNDKEKTKILSKSWIIVSTSLREGWGLNIIEAAACGTPAVVYQVSGLIESVKDKETGLICDNNTPENLAKKILIVLGNSPLRYSLSQKALMYSQQFSWDKTAKESLQFLKETLR